MTLLYRNKIYSNGHIKIAYLAVNKKEKAGLYFDLPPITPGEYRCAAWHQEVLHKSYTSKKKRYDLTAEYLIAIGHDASEFKKWPDHPVLTDMNVLKTDEALVKQALDVICAQLAQEHVDLAKRLHERDRKNRVSKAICVRTAEFVKKLPDLPLSILPLDDFIEIKTFLDHNK
jgi:hypothetical protein